MTRNSIPLPFQGKVAERTALHLIADRAGISTSRLVRDAIMERHGATIEQILAQMEGVFFVLDGDQNHQMPNLPKKRRGRKPKAAE